MHTHAWHQLIKNLSTKIAYACIVLLLLEGCQGCHRGAITPSEESPETPATVTPDLGGIPNLGNTCYMNAVLQIIAKLYPDIFAGHQNTDLAITGRAIVGKIRNDQYYVTRDEAEAFYTALLGIALSQFVRGRQESSDECIEVIWKHLNLHTLDAVLGTPYITLDIKSPRDVGKQTMLELLDDYAMERTIEPNFLNDIVPIKLNRNGNGKTKVKTVAKGVLQLTITKTHIPGLSQDMHCQLAGFIVHSGTATGGHYFAYIQQNGQWKLYNDAWVKEVSPAQAEQAAEQAYLYFYRYTS